MKKQKGKRQAVLPLLRHARLSFRPINPNAYYAGRSRARNDYTDCIVEVNDIFRARIQDARGDGRAREPRSFSSPRTTGRSRRSTRMAARRFRGGQRLDLGRRRQGSDLRLWKGVIEPRKSEGSSTCRTFCRRACRSPQAGRRRWPRLVKKDHYIDGLDQTSFLLAKNGESIGAAFSISGTTSCRLLASMSSRRSIWCSCRFRFTRNGNHGGFHRNVAETAGGTVFQSLCRSAGGEFDSPIRTFRCRSRCSRKLERYQGGVEEISAAEADRFRVRGRRADERGPRNGK